MTFVEFSERYAKIKETGDMVKAKRFLEKYRKEVVKEMAAKDAGPKTRFDREDPI